MDAGLCREHLETLLSEEASALAELERILTREHEILTANDVDALERSATERQACVGRLLRVEEERRSLCRMLGYPAEREGLEKLMAWCDPQGSLQARWAECAASATRCRDLNDRNGALVAARMRRVESLLGVITGRGAAPPQTYGPSGGRAVPRVGRMLTTEA